MAVEQLVVKLGHLVAVSRVHPCSVPADPARQDRGVDGPAGGADVDRRVAAKVQLRLGFLVPAVAAVRRCPIPFLEREVRIDMVLEAADPQLLATDADQRADRRKRRTSVWLDLRIHSLDRPPVREDGNLQPYQPATHVPPSAVPGITARLTRGRAEDAAG